MSEKIIPIPARLKNVSRGGHVAGAEDIIDDGLQKTLAELNLETSTALSALDVRVEALQEGTLIIVSELPTTGVAGKIYRVPGDGSYTDYMWDTSQLPAVFVEIATYTGNEGDFFNVNVYNSVPTTPYGNAALARGAVPGGMKKQGLQITYLLADGWFIDLYIGSAVDSTSWATASNWQTIGPVSISQNNVNGGVDIKVGSTVATLAKQSDHVQLGQEVTQLAQIIYGAHGRTPEETEYHSWLLADGTYRIENVYRTKLVKIYPNEKITIQSGVNSVYYALLKSDSNITTGAGSADFCADQSRQQMAADSSVVLTAPSDVVYLYVSIWNGTDVAPASLTIGETTEGLVDKVGDLEQIVNCNDLVSAIRRGEHNINLAAGEYELNEQLLIPSETKITGVRGKTIIRVHSANGLVVFNATDVKLQDLTIVGDAPDMPTKSGMQPVAKGSINDYNDAINEVGIGTQTGIVLRASEKIEIYDCEIKNFDAYGLKVVACGTNYRYAIRVENNWINNCYCGLKTEQEAERSNYFANVISLCQIGAYIDSGTNFFTSCAFNANYIGCVFGNGANAAHGHVTDCAFTHCTLHGLVCYRLFAGQIFNGCKIGYVDPIGEENGISMLVINSRGVMFGNGYLINAKIYMRGSYEGDTSSAHILNNNIITWGALDVNGCTLHKTGNYKADGTDSSQFND